MKNKFVIFCYPRTGSYLLTDLLGKQDSVSCYGEIFKQGYIELEKSLLRKINMKQTDVKKREENPLLFLEQVVSISQEKNVGFKMFPRHNKLVLSNLLADKNTKKIFLGRNPLQSYFSLELANKTNEWTRTKAYLTRKQVNITFDLVQFFEYLDEQKSFYERVLFSDRENIDGSIYFLDYLDLLNTAKMEGLATFIGLDDWKVIKKPKYKKQLSRPYEELVSNWVEVEEFCVAWNCQITDSFYDFMDRFIAKLYARNA